MAQKLTILEQVAATHITINVVCASLDMFWVYAGKVYQKRLPGRLLDNFGQFIIFDREAHFRTAVVTLLTLFDKPANAITLRSLIADSGMKKSRAQELLESVGQLGPRIEKIKKLRHNLYAHRNNSAQHNNIFAQAQLSRNDLEIVLKFTIRIVNNISKEVDGPRYERNHWARDQLLELIGAVSANNV